ncbi:5-bromo-4-chloroindolyl phosphate hydrolysis family protein [Bacillus songklensis]|uniref:5-bromo-4-chloroindolyl phosphate hydrolysis family protein n=1 Tax=Bacillus songklensis TaxID=1069116 RepID=A0ABV8AW19_9BACI
MKIIRTLLLLLFSGFVGLVSMPVSVFLLDLPLLTSFFIGIGIPSVTLFFVVIRFLWKRARTVDPYREETAYVKHQVKEARKKLALIGGCRFKVRSVTGWMKISQLYKLAKGIIKIVEDEPARYREVQAFFTQHLPATVTLADRYTFLTKQPVINTELKESLRQTELLMDEMASNYNRLLLSTLSSDVMSLEIEQKMLKQLFQDEKQMMPNSSENVKHKGI